MFFWKLNICVLLLVLIIGCQSLFFLYYFSTYYYNSESGTAVQSPTDPPCNSSGGGLTSKWIFSRDTLTMLENGLHSVPKLTLLLNIRRLVHFSVHEVNRKLGPGCVKWWASPLTLFEFSETALGHGILEFRLKFEVEPGRIPFEAVVRQLSDGQLPVAKLRLDVQQELELVEASRLDADGVQGNDCGNDIIEDSEQRAEFSNICLCRKDEEEAERKTIQIRGEWNQTDFELPTWLPDKSPMVVDYIDFLHFKGSFLMSPGGKSGINYCAPALKMIVMISSAPTHFMQRKTIRETFGSREALSGKRVRIVFLFGVVHNSTLQEDLNEEMEAFDDMIQANFSDSYHNLTLSHLSMYQWLYLTCNRNRSRSRMPAWLFKADDDFLLNIDVALSVAKANPTSGFLGCLFCGTKPIRDLGYITKYYVPRYMYAPEYYIGYLSGVAYMLRTELIPQLLQASLTIPITHMDDAYITGMLPRHIRAYAQGSNFLTYGRTEPDACMTKKTASSFVFNSDDMKVQWAKLQEPTPENCSLPTDYTAEKVTKAIIDMCMYE